MSDWIDVDPTYVGSQYPFSAMATVDWIEGNLERLYDQSWWQLQVGFHEDDEGAQALSTTDEWEIFEPIEQIPINIRPDRDGSRSLKITAEIKTTAGATSSWRFYALPGYLGPPSPDTTDGYDRGCAEITTALSDYAWNGATISGDDIEDAVQAVPAPPALSTAPDIETPRVVLVALASTKAAGTLTMRGLHIEEVIE